MSIKALIIILCLGLAASHGDERIRVAALINGQPVRLQFDSGTDHLVLHQDAATRLGLAAPVRRIVAGEAKLRWGKGRCLLSFGTFSENVRYALLQTPEYVAPEKGEDGLLGWRYLKNQVLRVNASERNLEFLTAVPEETLHWASFPLDEDYSVLAMEVPRPDRSRGTVVIDSGIL
jgi:hypothetical protein